MENLLTHSAIEGLYSLLSPVVDEIVEKVVTRIYEQEKPTTYLSRTEVCEQLHITLPTLHAWTKDGTLRAQKINGRVLYDEREIDKAIRCSQKNKRRH